MQCGIINNMLSTLVFNLNMPNRYLFRNCLILHQWFEKII